MKIIYMGTPEFAVKPLESLITSSIHEVVAVVCQPDKPIGRKAVITPPPVKVIASKYNIPVFQFEKIGDGGAEALKKLGADIMVTCAYGQILTTDILDVCPYGVINIHASVLPKYRGAAPIHYAIINGEKTTGVTFMKTEEGLDTGDIVSVFTTEIGETETTFELSERLSQIASEHVCDVLTSIADDTAVYTKQNDEQATIVKTIKKDQTEIDFSKKSNEVACFINGMSQLAFAVCGGKKFKFHRAKQAVQNFENGQSGEVFVSDKKLFIKCGENSVEVLEIQEEGGKKLSAKDFLNGRKLKQGDKFEKILC